MNRARALVAGLAVVALAGLAMLVSAGEPAQKTSADGVMSPVIREYQIQARQFEFTPNVIRVPVGTVVRLVVTSADVDHQLEIPGIKSQSETVQGRRQVLEFVAWPAGTYEIACAKVCGTSHDQMKGTLVVE
ncbi:MAG: cupredoxin domain-containing protein [Dehalococcoidia bacterium]|nr:cupredoxin domain-containing protein [Dehalococcoidia bacterium]